MRPRRIIRQKKSFPRSEGNQSVDGGRFVFIRWKMSKRTIFEVLFVLVFDRVEEQCRRAARWDEQPWIFVSIEIVEMDWIRARYDWAILNSNLVILA